MKTDGNATRGSNIKTAIGIMFMGLSAVFWGGCQSMSKMEPIRTESQVNLERFMGDWYVIAAIPIFLEKNAYNGLEHYELAEDGRILTTYTYNNKGFDGELKEHNPVGFVRDDGSNAIWGMQFIWPIKAEYRIVYLDDDYTETIIGRTKRDYVWIMAREPIISDESYRKLVGIVEEEGYDISKLRKVPQQPLAERS